jgi:hypothetical protein
MPVDRYTAVISAIDAANAGDPDALRFEGADHPRAGIEGRRAHHWLDQLRPDASEALRLATRAHHLRRWEVPRDSYPRTRAGYHAWRTGLYEFHAAALGDLMRDAGYPEDEIAEAARIMGKGNIKTDRDAQSYEDAVSLAFLELRLVDFAPSVSDDQLMRALRRTWRKMSDAGHAVALRLDLSEEAAAIVGRALAD